MTNIKKIFAILLLAVCLIGIQGCKKDRQVDENLIATAIIAGNTLNFAALTVILDEVNKQITVNGELDNGGLIDIVVNGNTEDTYNVGAGTSFGYDLNQVYYTTNYPGGSGTVMVTSIDRDKGIIQMGFSGFMVNTLNTTDVLEVKEGTIRAKFQF